MKRTVALGISVIGLVAIGGVPAHAANGYENWGQEVKDCNQIGCYPGGTSRGAYVLVQANDGEGAGYAHEIHTLAHPGKASPVPLEK